MSLVEDFTNEEAEPDSIFDLFQKMKADLEAVEAYTHKRETDMQSLRKHADELDEEARERPNY